VGKGISITHSECVSIALGIQHAMRVRHIVICCLSAPTIFFDVTSQTTQFSKNKLLNIQCILFSLQRLSETFLILRRTERDMIINAYACAKYSLFLSDLNENRIFSTDFRKIIKYQFTRKYFHREPSYSMRTDRRTGMKKLIVVIRLKRHLSNNSLTLVQTLKPYIHNKTANSSI
jgi:hypothetical protein